MTFKTLFYFVIICILPNVLTEAETNFAGDEVIRTFPVTEEHIVALRGIADKFDFWTEPRLGSYTDIHVSKDNKADLLKILEAHKIKNEVKIKSVESLFKVEQKPVIKTRKDGSLEWKDYESHNTIQLWVKKMATLHKDICEQIKIGQSFEKRDLYILWIRKLEGNQKRPAFSKKKALWLDGGIHAREWVSPAIVTWIINELLTNKTKHADILDNLDIYVFPQVNPDGYEYTRSRDRMWRKTRSKNSGKHNPSNCYGSDPNRNWPVAFGGEGSQSNPCSSTYRGPKALSEVETKLMADFITNRKEADWRIYITIHSYAQMILLPWGYKLEKPPDYPELERLAKEAAAALKAVNGVEYEVGGAMDMLGAGAGGSDDWAKGSGIFKYSYTIEARDTGDHGFMLPKNQIIPTCKEVLEAFLVFARDIAKQK